MKWHNTSEELPNINEEVIGVKYFHELDDSGYIVIFLTARKEWHSPVHGSCSKLKEIPYWTKLEPPREIFP